MDYKRLNQAELAVHGQIYRGGPLHNPSAETKVEVVTDQKVVGENKGLKKEIEDLKLRIKSAESSTKLEDSVKELEAENATLKTSLQASKDAIVATEGMLEAAAAERNELAEKLSKTESVAIPEVVFLNEVNKIRPIDDDFTKIYGKLSLERGGKEIEGVVIVANEASKHLKRIGA